MKKLLIASLLTFPALAQAGNYATCLLDKLPGLENDQAAAAANTICKSEYPGGLQAIPYGEGRGMLGYDSGAECALEESGDTRSRSAAYMIRAACNRLYDESPPGFKPYSGDFTPLQQ